VPKKKPQPKKSTQKKRRAAPEAAESHQRRQERLEARRRAKQEALIAQRKRERRDRATRSAVLITLLLAAVYFVFLRETGPESIQGNPVSQFSTDNGTSTDTHQAPFDYTPDKTGVKPPTSGRHDPSPAECGTHDQEIPDANLVHTLEHGAVGVLYDPETPLVDVKAIEEVVSSYDDHTFSAPYKGMEDQVTVVSWSRRMGLDQFDGDAVREYIDTFRNTEPAPEAGAECDNEEDETFDPAEDLEQPPSPEPAPSETEPPEEKEDGGTKGDDDPSKDDKGGDDKGGDKAKMEKEEEGN
jgi:Protein of unknown function (DUF3105)